MRVIAGKYRSRPLQSLRGLDLRPTADRLRETLFNVLTAGNPAALEGTVWLDLYAGTGAVGIEAISRGAGMVYFVESSAEAAELIRKNLQSLGIETGFQVLNQDAIRALRGLDVRGLAADFVFLDPPYRMEGAYRQILELLSEIAIDEPQRCRRRGAPEEIRSGRSIRIAAPVSEVRARRCRAEFLSAGSFLRKDRRCFHITIADNCPLDIIPSLVRDQVSAHTGAPQIPRRLRSSE